MKLNEIWTVVRLRWALTISTVNKSAWQAIAFVISCLINIGVVVGSWVLTWFILHGIAGSASSISYNSVLNTIALVWGGGLIFVAFCQLVAFGQQSVNAQSLYLLGVSRLTLRNALVLSQVFTPSGVASYLTLVGIMGQVSAFFAQGLMLQAFVWVLSFITSFLAVLFAALLNCTVLTAATVLFRSRRARELLTVIFVLLIVAVSQSGGFIAGLRDSEGSAGRGFSVVIDGIINGTFEIGGQIMQWTPLASFAVTPLVMARPTLMTAVFIIASIALYALVFWLLCLGFEWCLHRDIVEGRAEISDDKKTKTTKAYGLGLFGLPFVRGPLTAIMARIGTSWLRDVRYGLSLLMPVFFAVIFTLQGIMSGHPEMVVISVPLTGFFMSLMGMNMLAYEGPAFILHTMSGLKGCVDWYARSAFQLGLGLLMQFIMTAIAFAVAYILGKGFGDSWEIVLICEAVGIIILCAGVANSALMSGLIMFPVPSAEQPMKTPQGRTISQMFMPMILMLVTVVLLIPGVGAGVIAWFILHNEVHALWIGFIVQGIMSIVYVFAGAEIGGRITDKRRLAIHQTLRDFAELTR